MAVLDAAARLGDSGHGLGAQVLPLGERVGFVVALLRPRGIQRVPGRYHVVFKLAHRVEVVAGDLFELGLGAAQHFGGGAGERLPVGGVKRAEDVHGGHLREGVHEGGAVARHHVKVAGAGVYAFKEAGAVHPLPGRKDAVEVFLVIDHEIQGFKAAVPRGVPEVDHLDAVGLDVFHQVGAGKIAGLFPEESGYLVGVDACGFHVRSLHAGLPVSKIITNLSRPLAFCRARRQPGPRPDSPKSPGSGRKRLTSHKGY